MKVTIRSCSLVLSALVLLSGRPAIAGGAAFPPLNRVGYVSVLLHPDLQTSFVTETTHMPILERFFAREAGQFASALAETLEKTAFAQQVLVLPGNLPEKHETFRLQGEPDTFLLTVDLVPSFGFDGEGLGALATLGSFFLLSKMDLFTYANRLKAEVRTYYFTSEGTRVPLAERRYSFEAFVRGDFFQANDLRQEVQWIADLTQAAQETARRTVLADLPMDFLERAWRKAGHRLKAPPLVAGRSVPVLFGPAATASQVAAAGGAAAEPAPGVESLARRVGRSVCRVHAGEGEASGFVISSRGFVLTSLAVLGDAREATVQFHDGEELSAGVLLADRDLGLAVLAIPLGDYAPLALASAATIDENEPLLVFGYPGREGLSILQGKVAAAGVTSALLQIGAPLPQGNSGGPVLTTRGEVIGVAFALGEKTARLLPSERIRGAVGPFIEMPKATDAVAGKKELPGTVASLSVGL